MFVSTEEIKAASFEATKEEFLHNLIEIHSKVKYAVRRRVCKADTQPASLARQMEVIEESVHNTECKRNTETRNGTRAGASSTMMARRRPAANR